MQTRKRERLMISENQDSEAIIERAIKNEEIWFYIAIGA
jgi:hypothetical protein